MLYKSMGLAEYIVKSALKDVGKHTKQFYEDLDPPIDIVRDGDKVIMEIELPGFKASEIKCSIEGNFKFLGEDPNASVLRIRAKRKELDEHDQDVIVATRPTNIDKLILLPFHIKGVDKSLEKDNLYTNNAGILRITFDVPDTGKPIQIK